MVPAEGYQRLITHVFVEGDEHLDSDAVFGVRSALIAPFTLAVPNARAAMAPAPPTAPAPTARK